jgi:predicted DsbA family dithiol-disulfide isomerase
VLTSDAEAPWCLIGTASLKIVVDAGKEISILWE